MITYSRSAHTLFSYLCKGKSLFNQTVENSAGLLTTNGYGKENRLINEYAGNMETPITSTYDGDGLRRSRLILDSSGDPPIVQLTTFVWDGTDYLGEVTR